MKLNSYIKNSGDKNIHWVNDRTGGQIKDPVIQSWVGFLAYTQKQKQNKISGNIFCTLKTDIFKIVTYMFKL